MIRAPSGIEQEMLAELRRRTPRRGDRKRLAHQIGVPESVLSMVLNRKRPITDRIALALGYRRTFERIDPAPRPGQS